MSQPLRQSTLFAAEDYLKVFRSFKDVNFTNYDFDGIKRDLLSYISNDLNQSENTFTETTMKDHTLEEFIVAYEI